MSPRAFDFVPEIGTLEQGNLPIEDEDSDIEDEEEEENGEWHFDWHEEVDAFVEANEALERMHEAADELYERLFGHVRDLPQGEFVEFQLPDHILEWGRRQVEENANMVADELDALDIENDEQIVPLAEELPEANNNENNNTTNEEDGEEE